VLLATERQYCADSPAQDMLGHTETPSQWWHSTEFPSDSVSSKASCDTIQIWIILSSFWSISRHRLQNADLLCLGLSSPPSSWESLRLLRNGQIYHQQDRKSCFFVSGICDSAAVERQELYAEMWHCQICERFWVVPENPLAASKRFLGLHDYSVPGEAHVNMARCFKSPCTWMF
jgi:hypothetical protein